MSLWLSGALAAALAALLGLIATRAALLYLRRRHYLDHPNDRSSHSVPTPRGGGLGLVPAVLAVWAVLAALTAPSPAWVWAVLAGAVLLMATSWADDRHNLPAGPRFMAHVAVIAGTLVLLPAQTRLFGPWLPLWADRLILALGWLWFVNLFNFMDGIDGLAGVETVSLGLGIAIVAGVAGAVPALIPLALALAGGALGFLAWNWHPARVFLGDVGSIPLGFLLGALLLALAVHGQWAAALILPAYYWTDATLTLVRRATRGEKVWQAHRQHFYQRAVQGGQRHDRVALTVLGGNLVLIVAASLAARGHVAVGMALAIVVVASLLATLARWSRSAAA